MAQQNCVVFEGFTVLPMKVEEKSQCLHYLYIKEHSIRDAHPCKPKQRTLFVLNIPPYVEEEHLQNMFGKCGAIQRVYIQSKPTAGPPPIVNQSNYFPTAPVLQSYNVAYIVFKTPHSVQQAKCLPYDKPLILLRNTATPPQNTGLAKWCQEHKECFIDTAALQLQIDQYMEAYDKKIEKEKEEAKANEGVPDEEGWITVTRYGKNKGAPRTEAHEKALTRKEKKHRKEKELLNFYSFQIRDSKREQIVNLRKKFEEDKHRIALMRESRKFRPY